MHSIRNKCSEVLEHVIDNDADVVFLSETWMESENNDITAMIKSYGYRLLHERRKNREKEIGGGVGVMVRSTMIHKHHKCKFYKSFEHVVVSVKLTNSTKLMIITIYRLLFISASIFMEEFTEFLEGLNAMTEDFILSGDINFHLETDNSHVLQLQNLWSAFNMTQHVQSATHNLGHTIDLVLTNKESPTIQNLVCKDVQLSDHFMVIFDSEVEVIKQEQRTITFRSTKEVDIELFSEALNERFSEVNEIDDFGEKATKYSSVVREVVDRFAPLKTKTIKVVQNAPWFDSEYKELRKSRRKAEKKYMKHRTPENRQSFVDLRKQTTNQALLKKREHYNNKMNDCKGSKELYNCVNELLDRKKESVLPSHDSPIELAERFSKYFKEKIQDIRKAFPQIDIAEGSQGGSFIGTPLTVFDPTTDDEIREIVEKHRIKCSPEDPIPASLLKKTVEVFIPIWRELVNLSLSQGDMTCLKCAVLTPLIKAMDSLVDIDLEKNYRPVSNLLFVSKLTERVVDKRINTHMTTYQLHSNNYAYKDKHSTEFLLTKVANDLLLACDKKIPTLVMFLDLSAAFDTVDQDKLLKILHDDIGIRGTSLKWFTSYLCGRTQKVKIGDSYSDDVVVDFGVTQGLILGPKLFNIYTRPFPSQLQVVRVTVEGYADDHQLMKQFNLMFQVEVLGKGVSQIFEIVEKWMKDNFLKLNSGKTKIMIIAPDGIQQEIIVNGTFIEGKCIRFVETAKNLGFYFDSTLSLEYQIQTVVTNCYNTIRLLSRIKFFLSTEQLNQLVCSLVLSKLDYCNSLYYGLSTEIIGRLQSVQNSAARLVCKVNGYDKVRSDELFHKLHWLKVRERIAYKLLLSVYKCVSGNAPRDLINMLTVVKCDRTKKLVAKKCNGRMGDRAFSVCGPRVWNALPINLRMVEDEDDLKSS